MEETGNDFFEMQQQLQAAEVFLAERVRNCFNGKTVAEIKQMIKEDSDDVLDWLTEIALENESYEICAAVQQTLDERKMTRHFIRIPC